MLTQIELAVARLRVGEARRGQAGAFSCPGPSFLKRIDPLPQRLETVRAELTHSRYRGSAQVSDLDGEIEGFSRDTIVGPLSALPS
jgi:hypothetical protein